MDFTEIRSFFENRMASCTFRYDGIELLKARRSQYAKIDLNKLNNFGQLVHLEINLKAGLAVGEINLNLLFLKVLVFHRLNHRGALSIDCPELSVLVIPRFEFNSGDTLRSLPRLKELHYNATIAELFGEPIFEVGTLDRVKRALRVPGRREGAKRVRLQVHIHRFPADRDDAESD